jgi:ubiquinone/menaquinone biosynthesis C-methylase UbiE
MHLRNRRIWQNPREILLNIGLKPGDTFIDVGSGDGYFAIPVAEIVGGQGRIFALDSNEEALRRLKVMTISERLGNISPKKGYAEDVVLCRDCADFVFFGIVLHDFKDPMKVLRNAKIMLKKDGKLINLDFTKDSNIGPPKSIKFSRETATRIIERAGFNIIEVKGIEPHSYLIVAKSHD